MNEISVVMTAYNAATHIAEAIESVLNQSFDGFELIIVDDGSTDNTNLIVRSYSDRRIKLIKNTHDYIRSLNSGMQAAKGKYVARMDADDIMHIDRLKIQYAIMEDEPDIAVCSSWMSLFGEDVKDGIVPQSICGIIEHPLLLFLKGNFISHPTTMLRCDFLRKHSLQYKNSDCAEDYKLWIEIAKRGGLFYVEPQPLLYKRVSVLQRNREKQKKQEEAISLLRNQILHYLMQKKGGKYGCISKMIRAILQAREEELVTDNDIFPFIYNVYMKNKDSYLNQY